LEQWQTGGLVRWLGQNHHFSGYAPEKLPMLSSADRKETGRLYAALDHRCLLL
jgi:GSH-dependent disulfide-bond oxidoreductase